MNSCPYCKGSGIDPDNLTSREVLPCPACKGKPDKKPALSRAKTASELEQGYTAKN